MKNIFSSIFLDQGHNVYSNQWFNGYKTYPPHTHPSGWMDRSSSPFETANLFNSGYHRIPFFTYTAVLPFGFIYELKSQVIEIPLDVSIHFKYFFN